MQCLVFGLFACGLHAAHGALARGGGLAAAGLRGAERALQAGAAEEGKSPVRRVVELLGTMKSELESEAEKESGMYDKMSCWCDTNQKEKTQAIKDAEAKDMELSAEVESRGARGGVLGAEIGQLKNQIAQDTEALKTATAIREKEASEFRGEEKDLVQWVDNLRNAISVLAKHHGGTFVQLEAPLVSSLRVLLRGAALRYELLRADSPRSDSQRKGAELLQTALRAGAGAARSADQELQNALLGALDTRGASVGSLPQDLAGSIIARAARGSGARAGSFVQAPIDADYKSYSSRSSSIYGVLNQMLEEFEAELSEEQKAELQAIADFRALAKAKTAQITVGKEKLDQMEGEHATNQQALSDANEDLDLTRKQRSSDVEFVRNLKLTCDDLDKEWERRSETRSEELKAVTEAIAILKTDDNHELLARSVSLLQERQERQGSAGEATVRARRVKAAEALRRAAGAPDFDADDLLAAWHGRRGGAGAVGAAAGPRAQLSTLAVSVQLDSFTKVKEMMDKMLAELKNQQKEEVDFKEYCNKELDQNDKMSYEKTQQKKDLMAKAEHLAALIAKLAKEMDEAKAQIAATETEIKKASEAREGENADFQTTVADQRASQAVLKKALMRLKDFYSKGIGKKVIYVQRSSQTPPEKFNKYQANAGSKSVIGLLDQIIGDSKALEAEATSAEYKAQAAYEKFVTDSNALINGLNQAITARTKASAAAKLEAAETAGGIQSTTAELEALADYEADLHSQCDFVLKNFDIRQKARLQEMEAIQAAKAVLSGAEGSR